MCERTLQYFLKQRRIDRMDAAEVCWSHAVNSRSRLTEALTGPSHMIEADIIMSKEPIMAHPPDTDSDVTLKEWLEAVKEHNKGIKLDFKSLEAVSQSLALLGELLAEQSCPVWINADILCGPGGQATPLDSQAFLSAVTALPTHTVLSLGWTTGWTAAIDNPGYSWDMVRTMEEKCRSLTHPVTFPVRAALLAQSFSQLSWLLQQSDRFFFVGFNLCRESHRRLSGWLLDLLLERPDSEKDGEPEPYFPSSPVVWYTLTVWTGQNDDFALQDLLPYREKFDMSRIYYDLPNTLRTELSMTSHDHN